MQTKSRKKKILILSLVFMVIALVFGNSYAANAESPSTTVTSSYDDANADNLQFSYMTSAAQCDDITMSQNWSSTIDIANLADTTNLSVSIEEGKGGTIEPHGNAALIAHGVGSTATNVTLSYLFEADGTSTETTSFTIQAPDNGCMGKGGYVPQVNCTVLNFTDQSVRDDNGDYPMGALLKLETTLTGNDASDIKTLVYQATVNGGPTRTLQDSSSTALDFTLDQLGRWEIVPVLKDTNGNVVPPQDPENCIVYLDVVKAEDTTPPTTTPPTTTPPTTVPPTTVDTSSNAGSGTTTPDTTTSGVLGSTTSNEVASASELPRTGVNTGALALMAFALISLGFGFVLLSKRPAVSWFKK